MEFTDITFNKCFVDAISMFGKIGVNLFIVITGYYEIDKRFEVKKVIRIEAETLFVSWLLTLVSIAYFSAASPTEFDLGFWKDVVKCAFPTTFESYWYVSAFMILCFIKPFLNKFILSLSRAQLRNMIMIALMIWCVVPTLTFRVGSAYGNNNFLWMPVPYAIGAYLRLYQDWFIPYKRKIAWLLLPSCLIQVLSTVVLNTQFGGIFSGNSCYLRWSSSITSVIISVCLSCVAFLGKERNVKVVNAIATGAFTSYLIQEHMIFKVILYNDIVKMTSYSDSIILPVVFVASAILLLLAGVLLHAVYSQLEKHLLGRLFAKAPAWDRIINEKVYGFEGGDLEASRNHG